MDVQGGSGKGSSVAASSIFAPNGTDLAAMIPWLVGGFAAVALVGLALWLLLKK